MYGSIFKWNELRRYEQEKWVDKRGNVHYRRVLPKEEKEARAKARLESLKRPIFEISNWMTYSYEKDIYEAYKESKEQYCY